MSNNVGELATRALERLEHLTALESPSGDVVHLNALRDALVAKWRQLGLTVTITPGAAGDHLVAEWTVDHSEGHVLLVTHYDTVWSVGELERQPFTIDGDVVRGPGVVDMKSGIVAVELALEGLLVQTAQPIQCWIHKFGARLQVSIRGDGSLSIPWAHVLADIAAEDLAAYHRS